MKCEKSPSRNWSHYASACYAGGKLSCASLLGAVLALAAALVVTLSTTLVTLIALAGSGAIAATKGKLGGC